MPVRDCEFCFRFFLGGSACDLARACTTTDDEAAESHAESTADACICFLQSNRHTYKNAAQNTSVSAVETVMRHFLEKSKAKLDEALAKVDEVAGPETAGSTMTTQMTNQDGSIQTVEVEDLEEAETPESILLSTVSDEKSRDRTYRTLVTPWLRFLWESYRTALDTLRNNTRLEVLYQVRYSVLLL